ncbi:chromosome partitioning protein [Psychrobacillus glaciei]|uniref:Chromosome partitioning protein n=1 Tax=Psychrobacillus glaciei TaxID=2283160 RepID=A0A5J6SMN8_9BACI|nr:AAA family ATPase [Psychrobacillus glaciei]QFF98034.1 chromosome partitioning protein [Psychrobacillus glaciei]
MGKVVSLINWKGGVGKSTLTLHLGVGLQKKTNKRILIVDLDPQCNLSFLALGVDSYVNRVYKSETNTLKDVFDSYFNDGVFELTNIVQEKIVNDSPGRVFDHIDMILSHQDLILIDLQLARSRKSGKNHLEETRYEIEKLSILKSLLDQVKDDYEYVLLDCPPNVNIVTQNAFYASDYFVVPVLPDFLSTTGISLIVDYMQKFNASFAGMHNYAELSTPYINTDFGGIIFNMVDEYRGEPKATHLETMHIVSTQHAGKTFDRYITDGDGISTAASVNLPVYSFNQLPRSRDNAQKQSKYFDLLIEEFIEKII